MTDFAGLILAGGIGRRWGGPKLDALLPDGRTFAEACWQTLARAGAVEVAATVPPGVHRSIPGVHTLTLPGPHLDMFESLGFGLRWLVERPGWQAVVMLPVDHPLVQPATVLALAMAGPPAALPTLAGRHGHPVCLWRPAAEGIASGTLSGPTLREVLRTTGVIDVPVDDLGVRANCNTPQALQEAITRLST